MLKRQWSSVVLGLGTVLMSGCGGGAADSPAGSAGTGGVGVAGGGASVGGGGAGGGAGAPTGGGGSAGSGSTPSCTGPYAAPVPVFLEDMGFNMNGPSLTSDELELYYARGTVGSAAIQQTVVRRRRSSIAELFGSLELLPELAGVCQSDQHVNPDVSEDGLTLYVTCSTNAELGSPEGPSTLRVARRADRDASFVLEQAPAGMVFASAGISADELTAYSGGEVWSTAPQMFARASKSESFGGAQPVPGFTTPLNSPDISADGLVLFGAAPRAADTGNDILRATRASVGASFGTPEALPFMLDGAVGAPNVTARCALYIVAVLTQDQGQYTLQRALPQ